MEVLEMRMLHWIVGVKNEDKIRITRIKGTVKGGEIKKKQE